MSLTAEMPRSAGARLSGPVLAGIGLFEHIPLSLVQLGARLAVARVFWQSAQTKLASWPVTEQLFAYEYNLPLLDPAFAARLATATELVGALLLAFGFASRLGALMLLGVTATIQFFVFPQNWPEHLMWASLLLLIIARGAGVVSFDWAVRKLIAGRV
jgi:putative oxidoreductase